MDSTSQKDTPTKKRYLSLLGFMMPYQSQAMAFEGSVKQSTVFLQVSLALRHFSLLLGDDPNDKENPYLEGGADKIFRTCVRNLGHHQYVAHKYPHLVAKFKSLEDLTDQNPFVIDGIGKGGNSEGRTKISHTITYKTPFRIIVQKVLVSIRLRDISNTTLLSYLLTKALKATIIPESSTLVSRMIEKAFKINIKPPLLVI